MSDLPPRESMEFDVVIIGAGPAGLSAAIRLKQINSALNVVVLEKGAEVGAHILSGAVVDVIGINALLPQWREDEAHPFKTKVTEDRFLQLTEKTAKRLPNFIMPPLLSNRGKYVVSLGNVCRWLAKKAEALGVDIYPGFAGTEVLYDAKGAVCGIATGDMGVNKDGTPGPYFTRGMALYGKYILIGEGARGSLAKELIKKFALDHDRSPQKFGIGIKELWDVEPARHKAGRVVHSLGWPLDDETGGGSFLYHMENNQIAVGFVLHLDYKNPYLSPFEEFQRFKTHPAVCDVFEGAKRVSYGARAISEGGWQSVPKLTFPGGALIGCSAGFVNVPRIKGSHNAVLSGLYAANAIAAAIAAGRMHDEVTEIEEGWRKSAIGKDLYPVRNVKPLLAKYGNKRGMNLGGLDMWCQTLFHFSPFGTMHHEKADSAMLEPVKRYEPVLYPKPDGKVSFDRLSSLYLSGTHHQENEPCHLKIGDMALQKNSELLIYGGPSTRYCPAAVYEWVEEAGCETYVINAQNCVHCKTCDIKDPNGNITWTCPQGGEGPSYPNM